MMRERTQQKEEVLRGVILETEGKGSVVESLVCSITEQLAQARNQRPSALNSANPRIVQDKKWKDGTSTTGDAQEAQRYSNDDPSRRHDASENAAAAFDA